VEPSCGWFQRFDGFTLYINIPREEDMGVPITKALILWKP
jgi:hypothetical protein